MDDHIVTQGELTIVMADLNGDAIEEAIVRLRHLSQKSTNKLQIIILTVRSNDWHIVAKIEDTSLPIIGISAASSDWLEIIIKSPDSAIGTSYNYSRWHYNSQIKQYQKRNNQFSSKTPQGVILMNNDQIKTMSTSPVFP